MIRSQAGVIDPHELKDDRVLVDAIWLRQLLPMSLWIDCSVLRSTKAANLSQRPAFASSSAVRYSARFSTSMMVCG